MGKHESKLQNMKRGPDVFQRDRRGRRYRVQARLKRELSDYSQLYTQLSHCRPLPELSYNSAPQPKMSNCLIISCNSENTVNCQTVRSASLTILRYFSFRIDFGYIYQSRRDAPRCPQEAREVAEAAEKSQRNRIEKSPNRKSSQAALESSPNFAAEVCSEARTMPPEAGSGSRVRNRRPGPSQEASRFGFRIRTEVWRKIRSRSKRTHNFEELSSKNSFLPQLSKVAKV